jgi:hypothetical protein
MKHRIARNRAVARHIVFATIDDNLFWPVGKNDIVRIAYNIRQRGPAKTAVKNGVGGKVLLYIFPVGEGRTAYEQGGIFGWRLKGILFFKSGDIGRKRLCNRIYAAAQKKYDMERTVLQNAFVSIIRAEWHCRKSFFVI